MTSAKTMDGLTVNFRWKAALQREGQGYSFPEVRSDFFRKNHSGPAIYRWRIHPADAGQLEKIYIGEADDLHERVGQYLSARSNQQGGRTNKRVVAELSEAIRSGKTVFLDVAVFEPYSVDGVSFDASNLESLFVRRAIEYLLLAKAQKEGHPLLNKGTESSLKRVKALYKGLSGEQKKQIRAFINKRPQQTDD